MATDSANFLSILHQLLNQYFTLEEIRTLCFNLNVDYESVAGKEKPSWIRELLLGLGRNGRLPDLITTAKTQRPHVDWPPVPGDFQLPESLASGETAVPADQYHIYGDTVHGDKFTGDKIGRDKNVVGNVSGQSAVAVGERAQATINQYTEIIIRADNFEDLPPAPGEPPYKGLAYFAESDKDLFFGRETLSDELADRLQTTRFLVVIGASGSGKSSLLRAGIVPRLRARNWRIHIVKPGVHPLTALATNLTQDEFDPTVTDAISSALATDANTLHKTAEKLAARAHAERLLLAVDQFEELFTQCKDSQERQAFVDNLVNAAHAQGAVTVLLSMRADFYDRVSQFSALTDLISQQQVYIKPMAEEDLVRAIAEPAKRGGWQFVKGLVELFVTDVGREPGRLPLLSHALLKTWDKRSGIVMTLGGYDKVGGVKKAIAQTAEETYSTLSESEQAIAQRLFLRLTELGKGTEDTCRRVNQVELGEETDVQAVTQRLIAARLITTTQDGIDVAHEALIREWPRLRDWLDSDRGGLVIHRRLTDAEREWRNNERELSLLYSSFRLNEAEEWVKDNVDALNELEQAFLTASTAEQQRREKEKEAQQQRELEAEQKQKSFFRRGLIGVTVLSLFLLVAVFVAWGQRNAARKQAAVALSGSLAMSSLTVGHENDMRALLLAIAAGQQADTPLAFTALHTRLPFMPPRLQTLSHEDTVWGAGWNADASQILTWSVDGTAKLWAVSGEQLQAFSHNDWIWGAGWNADESQILTWSNDGTAALWVAASGKRLQTFSHKGAVYGAAWNADESQILTWSSDGTAALWAAASGERLQTFSHEAPVYGAAWNEDESQILTWSWDGTAVLWAAASGKRLQTFYHEDRVTGASWNADESQILTWSWDGTAVLWAAANGERLQTLSHEDWVNGAGWNEDESQILTWSSDGTAKLWNAVSGVWLQTLSHDNWVNGAAWNADESQILTWSSDGMANLWEAVSGELLQSLSHEDKVNGAAWNGDESQILTWSNDGTAKLWAAATGERLQSFSHEDWIWGATWNADESQILTWSKDRTAALWAAASGEQLQTLSHEAPVFDAMWNGDESQILTRSENGTTFLWAAASGKQLQVLSHEDSVNGAKWNADESQILTWSNDSKAILWAAASGERLQTLSHKDWVNGAAWNADESQILTWSRAGTAALWATASGERLQTLSHEDRVTGAVWNADESQILTWSWDGTAKLWNAVSGVWLQTLSHDNWVNGAAWNADGSQILTWSSDGTAALWAAASGKQLQTFSHKGVVNGAAWNADESQILTWSWDGTAALWAAASGKQLQTFSHKGVVNGAAWNADESQILTWSWDGTVVLWAAASRERLQIFSHDDSVNGAAWNKDESQILTWSDDGTAKLWDPQTRQPLLIISPDGTPITVAKWNHDERRLLIATSGGIVRTYDTDMAELIDAACQVTTRNLTRDEWQLYFPGEAYQCTCGQWSAGRGAPSDAAECLQK